MESPFSFSSSCVSCSQEFNVDIAFLTLVIFMTSPNALPSISFGVVEGCHLSVGETGGGGGGNASIV